MTALTVKEVLSKIVEQGDGDAPALVEINGVVLPLTSVAQGMEEKRVIFVARKTP